MNIFGKALAVVMLLISSSASMAAGYITDFSGEGVSVYKYFVHTTGAVTFFVTGAQHNPDGCYSIGQFHIKSDTTGRKEMISALMMAFAAGKKVGLYSSKCEVIPFWGGTNEYPIISNLWVNQ